VIVKMIVEKQMECRLAGETEVLGEENLPQRHFCPSQNPTHDQTRVWTRAAAVGMLYSLNKCVSNPFYNLSSEMVNDREE
jgi:hypothetical protein